MVCHLSNKWTIDNGADTHVINSDINFEETRRAGENELLIPEKGAFLIKSYGNVAPSLRSNLPGEYLLLKDIALVPGFVTNSVSLDKLTKASIDWSSKNPNILERDEGPMPLCEINQSGSHWVLKELNSNIFMMSESNLTGMIR